MEAATTLVRVSTMFMYVVTLRKQSLKERGGGVEGGLELVFLRSCSSFFPFLRVRT